MELSGTPFDNETVSSNSWLVTVHYISRISSLHPHHPSSGFPSSAWSSSSLVPFSDQSGVNDCDDVLRRVWWWWRRRRRWWRQVNSIRCGAEMKKGRLWWEVMAIVWLLSNLPLRTWVTVSLLISEAGWMSHHGAFIYINICPFLLQLDR